MDEHPHGLDDPAAAAFAWARFRRILLWMGVVAVVFIAAAVWALQATYGPLSFIAILAVVGGAGGSIMLAAALMGLVFLSSGTGHDESVDRRET
ncbi:hypothetical protein PX554_21010 [Sphingomonas sp. H39-1-10]|uniref:hypothetical protein n=1 Tax=Sphingomonas TaxID=13687 RepID=UPI00087F1B4A|nr:MULTISPECIES: hypothetical protein [Sphingomonas]MDF0490616.1 hypothetical protein [Sphingomonas pollutisoli]SDA36760.1 hypothetical protein SAMN03159340_03863 [Sphingomonas sp. NFR15]